MADRLQGKRTLPKLSIVTPSLNQAEFLERTMRSVLDQGYPNLEYIVIDGGSSDGSVDIIRQFEDRLAFWVSEPDGGQAQAINKGLRRASGDFIGWQNSDDIYYPDAFARFAAAVARRPDVDLVIGDINLVDARDTVVREMRYVRPTYRSLLAEGMVLTNQAAFWRRSLHDAVGWLDESLHYGFDYEWFLRLLRATDRAAHVSALMGALRYHEDTKTSRQQAKFDEEYAAIRSGRSVSTATRRYFQLRRLALTLMDGKWSYVARGIARRLTGGGS